MNDLNSMTETGEVSLLWFLAVILRERVKILTITLIGICVALGVLLLKPRVYTVTSSFVPSAQSDPSRAGLASLAGQFGVSLGASGGQAQSPQLYADLLQTREVLAPIAADTFAISSDGTTRLPLSTYFRVSGETAPIVLDKTVRILRDKVVSSTVATRTTGVVTVSVKTHSARLSLALSERLLSAVNEFNLVRRQSQATAERRFVGGRLTEARDSLRAAEDRLQAFLQQNRQSSSSPELVMRRQRHERDVELQQQVVIGLSQQYEESRIREVRDTPVIMIIERPTLPARADSKGAVGTMLLGLFVALFCAVLWSIAQEALLRRRGDRSDAMLEAVLNEIGAMRWGRTGKPEMQGPNP